MMININVCKILFILCSLRATISKEVSPVRSYSKPEQSLDYRPRKTKPSSSHLTDAETGRPKPRPAELQKELEAKLGQRRRSHSVSSPAEQGRILGDILSWEIFLESQHSLIAISFNPETFGNHNNLFYSWSVSQGYYNGANGDRPPDEKMDSHYIGMGRSLELEYGNLGPLPGPRGPSKYNETTSSNDTVFYDRDMLLSDLYVREKEIKYSDSSRTKRTRTKSESRGISEENSPTRINENDQIISLLKGNRRPLEVDAKEFRVLKEKLLREQSINGGPKSKKEVKKVNQEQWDPRPRINVECELTCSDKVNGRLPSDFKDDEVFWKEHLGGGGGGNHKEIVLDSPSPIIHEEGVRLKPSRKSRREDYEGENNDYKHQKPSESNAGQKSKASIEKHVSSKEYETRMRDSLPLHYSREEKEWLKEKLLEEFERQEKLEVGEVKTMTDKLSVETAGKENLVNCVSPGALSPPCTCGGDLSPDPPAGRYKHNGQASQLTPSLDVVPALKKQSLVFFGFPRWPDDDNLFPGIIFDLAGCRDDGHNVGAFLSRSRGKINLNKNWPVL